MKLVELLAAFAFLIIGTGCASIINGRHQMVFINSNPPGATIYANYQEAGKTPAQIAFYRKNPPTIKIEAPGHFPRTIRMERELSGWYYMNMIFPVPIGGIIFMPIDRINGSAWTLLPDAITVNLSKFESAGITPKYDQKNADFLPDRFFEKKNVAVAPIDSLGVPDSETKTLTESLRVALVSSDYFTIVSRSDMEKIFAEQEFQRSTSCSDTECLIEMGKILSAEKIIGGSVGKLGDTYSITLRMIDIETGKVEVSVLKNVYGKIDRLFDAMAMLGNELALEYSELRSKQ